MKKFISLLLAVVMLLSLSTMAFAATSFQYTDYAPNDWYFRYVEKAVANGWMNGVGGQDFNPNGVLNRAMFVTILHRIAGEPAATKEAAFSDVAKGTWYENAVKWAAENGVVNGYADGRFGVSDPLTREQMATILYRYAKAQGKDVSVGENTNILSYDDAFSISEYAISAFQWACGAGIMSGTGSALNPKGTSTRAQAATVLVRFDAAEEAATLTRADLEKAVLELAWDYSVKGDAFQYDSQNMTNGILNKYYSGTYRVTEDVAPEYGIDDTAIFSVCSDYTQKVYYNALNERFMGFPLDWVTVCLWKNTENVYNGKDIVIARYFDEPNVDSSRRGEIMETSPHIKNAQEMREFIINWKDNLRPGDIMVPDGHAMLYIGNGYMLDCAGGKYDLATGGDAREGSGAANNFRTVEDCFVTGKQFSGGWIFPEEGENKKPTFVILRPLDAIVTDDGDGNPANDKAIDAVSIPETTRTRMQYPCMDIRHSADIGSLGTAVAGGNVTYKVDIYNKTNDPEFLTFNRLTNAEYTGEDYKGVTVTEVIPEGTEFVSANEGGVYADGKVTWTVDVAAGAVKKLAVTVKVTAPAGSTIVNEGGFVGNIPAKVLTNKVGGQKLTDTDRETLRVFYDQYQMDWQQTYGLEITDETSVVEEIYSKVLGKKLELPSVQELFDGIYEQVHVNQRVGMGYNRGTTKQAWLYTPKADAYETNPMLVRNYLGGQGTWFRDDQDRVNEFEGTYLEPGDIVFHVDMSAYKQSKPRTVQSAKIMVWLGNEKYALYDTATKTLTKGNGVVEQWKAFLYDAFFVLRPSQGLVLPESGKKVTPMTPEQAEAATLAKYPGIQVKRTLDASTGGVVQKGTNAVYTVSVTNGGTVDYKGVNIVENIPENTKVKKAEGATNENGRLCWTVDVPAGQTVSVTYTLNVTAETGVVESVGKVEGIQIEMMRTSISKNLFDDTSYERFAQLRGMTGEKIMETLNTTGKRGLDQIRTTYTWLVTGEAEMHAKFSSGIRGKGDTNNHYKSLGLNQQGLYTMPGKNEGTAIITNATVDGFWGGSAMDTAPSSVYATKPTTADLQIGDMIVQSGADEAITWYLYLGEGKFIRMCTGDPNGTAPTFHGEEVIESCYNENVKFFVLLRMSQLFGMEDF